MPVDSGGNPPPPSVADLRERLARARNAERVALAEAVRYREGHRHGPWSQIDSGAVATFEAHAAVARAESETMNAELTMLLVEQRLAEEKREREAEKREREAERRFSRWERIATIAISVVALGTAIVALTCGHR